MAGTIAFTHDEAGVNRKIIATCTADAADASFPAEALPTFEGRLQYMETNPGTPAPTTLYDITIINQNGLDVLQGVGANRHTTNSERVNIVWSGGLDHPIINQDDVLTLTIAGNIVNDAVTVVELVYSVT